MSIIPNYLALYNLSQIEADILIVSDLTATTGTIYTLNSTTGNITTLNTTTGNITTLNTTTGNITTANITTLLTDLWRGSTASSSMVIGVSGDSGTLTSWRNLIMEANKTITLNATGGKIICDTFTGTAVGSAISLFGTSTSTISFGNLSGGIFSINPNTTMNGNLILASSKTITLNATGGEILSPKYNSTSSTQALTIGGTNTTSEIRIGGALTSGILELGTIGTMTGGIRCNGDLSIGTTANNKGIACNFFTGLQATNLIRFLQSTTTGSVRICEQQTSGGITIGHLTPASDSGTLTINKNTTLGAGKNLTINSINKIICNTYEGTSATESINLFTTTSGSPTFPTISLGNTTNSGAFIINPNTTMNNNLSLASSKTITLNATGGKVLCNVYTGTATSSNLTIGESGNTGDLLIYKTITTGNTYSGNNTFSGGNTHSGSNTFSGATNTFNNTILGNTIQGTTGASSISLYGTTTASVNFATALLNSALTIGSASFVAGTNTGSAVINLPLTCNQKITTPNILVSGLTASKMVLTDGSKNLISSSYTDTDFVLKAGSTMTGTLNVNNIQGSTTSASITLFTNSSASTPTITIGNTSGGNLIINPSVVLSSTKSLSLTTLNSNSSTTSLTIGGNITNNDMNIATSINVGNINIGNNSSVNAPINLRGQVVVGNNKDLVMQGTGIILCSTYNSPLATTTMYIANTSTTGSVFIGDVQTSGGISLGNRFGTGQCAVNTKFNQIRQVSSIDRASFFNVAIGSANNIFQSSMIKANAMPPIYAFAQTDGWSVWESDTENEGSFIGQNGNTTIICNPGDYSAFHWQDEDTMGSASGFKFSVTGVMSTSSDRRLKRDINPITVASDLLDKLSLIEYVNYKKKSLSEEKYFKNGKLRQKYQDIHKGLIAQDVKQIFPEVVEREGEYFMMKYAEIDIYFNMGVQELIKRDKEKQTIIDDLKNKATASAIAIDDLTARIIKLEKILLNH